MGRPRDGGPLQEDVQGRRPQHRRLQRARRRGGRARREHHPHGADRLRPRDRRSRSTSTETMELVAAALHRGRRRRDGRPHDGGRQGHRGRDPAARPDGARGRHPPHHGDAAALGRRHHRHHQGQLPDPHLLPGDEQDRLAHHPGRAGRRAAARPGRHALHGGRRAHLPRPRPLRLATARSRRSWRTSRRRATRTTSTSSRWPRTADEARPSRRGQAGVRQVGLGPRRAATSTTRPCRSCCATRSARPPTSSAASQVGYNKAASLVERMEKEGIVGQANNAGKREILVYSRDLRYSETRDGED